MTEEIYIKAIKIQQRIKRVESLMNEFAKSKNIYFEFCDGVNRMSVRLYEDDKALIINACHKEIKKLKEEFENI